MAKPIPDTDPLKRKPSGQSSKVPEGGNMDARLHGTSGPGQHPSDVDDTGKPTKRNPGHTNPAHNTPGHERGDKPDRRPRSAQVQPPSYPGIMGPKARALADQSKPPTEPSSEKHPETIPPRRRNPGRGPK